MEQKKEEKNFLHPIDGLSMSLRFLLPVMGAAYFYAYQGDMHAIKDSITDIKESQAQNVSEIKQSQSLIWQSVNNLKDDTNNKFIQIYQRLK